MEDNQDESKSIKFIKFNNKKEEWAEFALKFKAIADERGYAEILNGLESVSTEIANHVDDKEGKEKLRLRNFE